MNHINSYRMLCTILLAGFLLFISPMSAVAQTIGWEPLSMSFQNVLNGTTETQTLILTNTAPEGGLALEISSILWTYLNYYTKPNGDTAPAFSYTPF